MRIISKFKDYYDSAHGWYSPEPVYVRDNVEIFYPELDKEVEEKVRRVEVIHSVMPRSDFGNRCVVAFCGKAYPCYCHSDSLTFYSTEKMENYFKKDLDSSDYMKRNHAEKIINMLHGKARAGYWWRYSNLNHRTWKRFLSEGSLDVPVDAFIAVKSPVFLVKTVGSSTYLEVNPMLNKLSFASQVDPYTAFQEISMYIGNELVMQMDPNLDRTDDMIRDSKGFNEWSFRRHKDENKKRKKK